MCCQLSTRYRIYIYIRKFAISAVGTPPGVGKSGAYITNHKSQMLAGSYLDFRLLLLASCSCSRLWIVQAIHFNCRVCFLVISSMAACGLRGDAGLHTLRGFVLVICVGLC